MQCDALVGALCDAIEPTLFGVAVLRTMRRIAVVQTDYVVPPAFTTWPHMVERVLSMIRISNTSASTSASDSVPADLRLHAITLMERLVQPAALLDSLPALRVELFPTLFLALEDILASDALLDEAATSLANREAAVFLMILFRLSSSKFSAVLASDFLSPQHNVVKCVATFLMRARDRGRIAYRLGRDATFLDMFSNPLSAATMCCWGIAENGGVAGAAALLQEGIIDLYVHALEQADDHSDSWTIFVKSGFRMISNAARHAVVAQHLRASTLPRSLERFRFGDANQGARVQGEAIHAIFLKSFLFGRDEV